MLQSCDLYITRHTIHTVIPLIDSAVNHLPTRIDNAQHPSLRRSTKQHYFYYVLNHHGTFDKHLDHPPHPRSDVRHPPHDPLELPALGLARSGMVHSEENQIAQGVYYLTGAS